MKDVIIEGTLVEVLEFSSEDSLCDVSTSLGTNPRINTHLDVVGFKRDDLCILISKIWGRIPTGLALLSPWRFNW